MDHQIARVLRFPHSPILRFTVSALTFPVSALTFPVSAPCPPPSAPRPRDSSDFSDTPLRFFCSYLPRFSHSPLQPWGASRYAAMLDFSVIWGISGVEKNNIHILTQ